MKKHLHHIRRQYVHEGLQETELPGHPLVLFDDWFMSQHATNEFDANAMAISTVGLNGFPESRIVLLKEYSDEGFVFFTHYKSQKGVAIAMDNKVALLFFWPEHSRQVRITGTATKISAEESDKYFKSRPFESQVSSSISPQSEKVSSRSELEEKYEDHIQNFTNETLKRPENWGGYMVTPIQFEFWQGRENRLHDRIVYKLKSNNWNVSRLAP